MVASGHNSSMDIEKSPWMKSFVLCTDSSQPIIDDDHFNDSSHFELPLITAINEKESETPLVDFNIHCKHCYKWFVCIIIILQVLVLYLLVMSVLLFLLEIVILHLLFFLL